MEFTQFPLPLSSTSLPAILRTASPYATSLHRYGLRIWSNHLSRTPISKGRTPAQEKLWWRLVVPSNPSILPGYRPPGSHTTFPKTPCCHSRPSCYFLHPTYLGVSFRTRTWISCPLLLPKCHQTHPPRASPLLFHTAAIASQVINKTHRYFTITPVQC